MKAPHHTTTPNKLTGAIQLARIRLANAESALKAAKEQARLAKRRRKEAKQAARRARKQARLAKREVADAKQVLAKAEKKFARAGRNAAKARAKKKAAASPAPKSVKPGQSTAKPAKPMSSVGSVAGGAKPVVAVSVPGNPATVTAGQAVEETLGGSAELGKPVEPGPEASQN